MNNVLKTEKETIAAGVEFAKILKPGDVVLLYGELGSGKTTFVKGIAQGLGIKETITSPTFTLMNIYKINNQQLTVNNLVHMDTYRLKNSDELKAIGAEDYIGDPNTITVIEWPEKIEEMLKSTRTRSVYFEHAPDGRKIKSSKEAGLF